MPFFWLIFFIILLIMDWPIEHYKTTRTCPRSEAMRANMLVVYKEHQISERQLSLLSLLFTTKFSSARYFKNQLNYSQLFEMKTVRATCKI